MTDNTHAELMPERKQNDPDFIYLQPYCCAHEREWCEDDVWEHYCDDGQSVPTPKYIRSDLTLTREDVERVRKLVARIKCACGRSQCYRCLALISIDKFGKGE